MRRVLLPALLSLVLHAGALWVWGPRVEEDEGFGDTEVSFDALDPAEFDLVDEGDDADLALLPVRVSILVDVPDVAPAPPPAAPPPVARPAAVPKPVPQAKVGPPPPPDHPPPEPPPEPVVAPEPPPPEVLAAAEPVAPSDEEIAAAVAESEAAPMKPEEVDDDADDADEAPPPAPPPKARRPPRAPHPFRFAKGPGRHPPVTCAVVDHEGIERTAPDAWRVDRSLVDYYATHIRELMKLAAVFRHMDEDGKPDGFKIALRRCSLLREGGLRSGDIVHSVNGIRVHDVFTAIRAYFKLRTETNIVLDVDRRGRALTLHYELAGEKQPRGPRGGLGR